jgi:hypothetical protein
VIALIIAGLEPVEGFRPRPGGSAGITRSEMLHSSGNHAQMSEKDPCPAGADPAALRRQPRSCASARRCMSGATTGWKSGRTCSAALCWSGNGAASAPKAIADWILTPDPGAAINALAALLRAKRRRGYQDRTW